MFSVIGFSIELTFNDYARLFSPLPSRQADDHDYLTRAARGHSHLVTLYIGCRPSLYAPFDRLSMSHDAALRIGRTDDADACLPAWGAAGAMRQALAPESEEAAQGGWQFYCRLRLMPRAAI